MRKLYKLREWLIIEEAAKHLSTVLGEPVSAADLFRLALDNHLTLSVNLVNHAQVKLGTVTPFKDVPIVEFPLPLRGDPPGEVSRIPMGMLIEDVDEVADDTRFVCFDDDVVSIDGIWDLPMRGAERIDIEHAFQQLTGGPPVELINMDGTFLVDPDGQWVSLQEDLPQREPAPPRGSRQTTGDRTMPANGLPPGSVLVVRTRALTEFVSKLLAMDAPPTTLKTPIGARERDTLLKLLIGMAIEAYRYDPTAARSGTPAEIASDLAKHGLSVTDDTVRKYLKDAAKTVLPKRRPA